MAGTKNMFARGDRMRELTFYHPHSLEEALECLARDPEATKVVAGGTDLYLQVREKQVDAKFMVDLSHIPELHFFRDEAGGTTLGPTLTFAELMQNQTLCRRFPGLVEAAGRIGSPQVRNRGTVGGNIGRASPAGDCSVALLSLGAEVTLRSLKEQRTVPLSEFFTGPGSHIGRPEEVITEIRLPAWAGRSGCSFIKLGKRKALILAIAAVAAYVELDEKSRVRLARVALGSLAPTPRRSFSAEAALEGQPASMEAFVEAGQAALADIDPIDDLRASADYRREVTPVLVRRALSMAAECARSLDLDKSWGGYR